MALATFNINDAGIQLSLDGKPLRTSPGYAVLHEDNLMVGELAASKTKLLPRWTNSRFWSQLTTTTLDGGTSQIRHHADLVFAHLEDLWKPISERSTDAIFVVPGYYSPENLSLLLGIAKECGIPLRGVVDNSVIAASDLPLHKNILHLDLHLHSITLTRLENKEGSLSRVKVNVLLETGLATLLDRWADIIADQFIRTTRFDPMHQAESEQQLFNLLPAWIKHLGHEQMHAVSLKAESIEHSAAVSKENLLRACTPIYPQIVQAIRSEVLDDEHSSLILSHQFEGFPGLIESLSLVTQMEITNLDESKTLASAYLHRDEILRPSETAISHVLRLNSGEKTDSSRPESKRIPTHLLFEDKAYPIGKGCKLPVDRGNKNTEADIDVCNIYLRNNELFLEKVGSESVSVNGKAINANCALHSGDIINAGHQKFTLITVLKDG